MNARMILRVLLYPFALIFGVVVSIRGFLYDRGLLRSVAYDLPIISVGNLSVGGSGKTPHIEYLLRLLQDYLDIATLSRGYKRKTKGYFEVRTQANAELVGDEPLQFKRKFPKVMVTVAENRLFAIPKIMMQAPHTQLILLDDAFQHRPIKPGQHLLLTEYSNLFTQDTLMPAGRLREWPSSYKRAHKIIVTKCPPRVTEFDRLKIIKELNPTARQSVYFSYYKYHQPYSLFDSTQKISLTEDLDVILICAIARTDYLLQYLDNEINYARVIEYTDHHYFSKSDIAHLNAEYERLDSKKKIILTTEKDATRLELHNKYLLEKQLPVYVLPIEVDFHFDDKERFDKDIKDFLLNFKV